MSYLSDLYSRLSGLTSQKNGIEADLGTYKNRKSDIESLIRNLTSIGDNNYSNVNKYANDIINNLSGSLKGTVSVSRIIDSISSHKEKSSDSDGKVSMALGELKTELSRVNIKIDSLNADLTYVKSSISSTNSSIWYEEKRIAEEKAKAALEAINGN